MWYQLEDIRDLKDKDNGSENEGKNIKIENMYTQSISKYIQGILFLHYQKTRIFSPFPFHRFTK